MSTQRNCAKRLNEMSKELRAMRDNFSDSGTQGSIDSIALKVWQLSVEINNTIDKQIENFIEVLKK